MVAARPAPLRKTCRAQPTMSAPARPRAAAEPGFASLEADAGKPGFFEHYRIALSGVGGIDDAARNAFARGPFVSALAAALDDLGPGPVEGMAEKPCFLGAECAAGSGATSR